MFTGFDDFRRIVRSVFPHEKWESIYFSQLKDGYSAAYKPNYPESSNEDVIINDIQNSGAYLNGNYELIHFHDGKPHVHYAEKLIALKIHVK